MRQNLCSKNLEKVVNAYRMGSSNEKILPPILVVEPTNRCNIDCVMCPTKAKKANGYMDLKLYKKVTNQAKDALKTILIYFRGESLLHPNLIDMIKYVKDNTNARVILSTNATLLTKELSEEIIRSGLNDIVFSIDGNTKQTYEKIRRGANYYHVIKNVQDFISLKHKMSSKINVVIQLIKLKQNKSEIEAFKHKWRELGCTVDISWFNTWANQIPNYNNFSDKFNPNLSNPRTRCADLWFKCVVTHDGKVVLCCHDFMETEILGDLKKQKLLEIWNSEKISLLRDIHMKGSFNEMQLCHNCMEWSKEEDEYLYFPEFDFKGLGGRP